MATEFAVGGKISKVINGCKISKKAAFSSALLVVDALLVSLIIAYVPYTKIDWDAYMSQVTGFLQGERDYRNLKGDTGPLVYPAGFLYVYSAIQYVTGGEVYPAQILFGILYIVNLGILLFVYVNTDVLPWWAFSLLCLSKRVHSIFVLRLFNDCFAMTFLHAALALLLYQRWDLGLIIFSVAVSIKMNVLLYAPPLLVLMLKAMTIKGVISALTGAALVQILLGLPFLLTHPVAYISGAFNLGRVFIHFWSVNFKFVPEEVFVSKGFAFSLLIVHLVVLAGFAHYRWCKREGGIVRFLHSKFVAMKLRSAISSSFSLNQFQSDDSTFKILSKEHIVTTMFVGNFIGIVCARSLHYQFYSWLTSWWLLPPFASLTSQILASTGLVVTVGFASDLTLHMLYWFLARGGIWVANTGVEELITGYFYSLPFLLWKTTFPTPLRIILFLGVELCWNIYPSNLYSSSALFCIHVAILWGLWTAPCEYPYLDGKSTQNKEE